MEIAKEKKNHLQFYNLMHETSRIYIYIYIHLTIPRLTDIKYDDSVMARTSNSSARFYRRDNATGSVNACSVLTPCIVKLKQ